MAAARPAAAVIEPMLPNGEAAKEGGAPRGFFGLPGAAIDIEYQSVNPGPCVSFRADLFAILQLLGHACELCKKMLPNNNNNKMNQQWLWLWLWF